MSSVEAQYSTGYRDSSDDARASQFDIYQDLLVPEIDKIELDVSMLDAEKGPAGQGEPSKDALETVKEEDSDSEFLWAKMQEHFIELSGSESEIDFENEATLQDITKIKAPMERRITTNDDGERIMEVLDSDDEGFVLPVKEEPYEPKFDWKDIPQNTIELSDDDAEVVVLGGSTSPSIKLETSDIRFSWADMGDSEVIELRDSEDEGAKIQQSSPNLGNSLLRRTRAVNMRSEAGQAKLRRIQRLYAARALEGSRMSGGAPRIFSVPQAPLGDNPLNSNPRSDGNAWMRCTPKEADGPSADFVKAKHLYKAKKKAKEVTIEDEIGFKKAQMNEKARLRRLEAKMYQIDSSEEEAEENDDGLFVLESTAPTSSSKRANPADIEADGDDEGGTAKGSKSKRQKNFEKPARTKAELRSELYHNLMAGYEEEAAKDKKEEDYLAMQAEKKAREEDRQTQKAQKDPNAKHTHELLKGKKPGKKSKAKSKSKTIDLTVRNLKTTNIYEESNANLNKLSMPTMHGKEKRKAMTDLIASIPLEESKRAKATSDKASILKATTILGNCRVNENRVEGEGDWNLKGLKTPLFHYQVQGAAKMKERENGEKVPLGGLLADEMGFGKTIMAIAAMIANPPAPNEEQRCTLIICNPAIISQWDDEMFKHAKPDVLGTIIRHHGYTRVSGKGASGRGAAAMMEKAGVVLSTYSEVMKSYLKCDIPEGLIRPVEKMKWWKSQWEQKRGLLHRVQFYRVILDESQAIKNHRAQTSIACRALMAKHRWAVSGTPIQNRLEELYPYFKFLRIPSTASYQIFKQNFCLSGSDIYNQRLHSFLDHVMIRRSHQDELLGTAIIQLPKAHQATVYLNFNNIERKIYEIIEKRFVRAINGALRDGTLQEDRSRMVLTMVLRLRQMTSHLFMLQETMEKIFEVEDIEQLWSDTAQEVSVKDSHCTDMAKTLRMMIEAKDNKPETETNTEKVKKGKEEPELIFKFRKYLRSLKEGDEWAELKDRSRCHRCKLPPDEPMLTSCMHLYCGECLKAMAFEAAELDMDCTKCLDCNQVFTGASPCAGLKELEADTKTQAFRNEGEPERPHRTPSDTMKWVNRDDQILPSTKTGAVLLQIDEWLTQFPTQKIIVFSQFHLIFQILGKDCEKRGWKFCFYHGKMSHKAREEAVENFRDDAETKIMIASLKCGGIGLNLTMASRVICIDLWFNSAVEQQAFCRVLRIGQREETHITRFVVNDSIDKRLEALQQRKDEIISAAMDDRTVLAQLSLENLLSLFGEVRHDDNSRPFIYAEDDQEKCWGSVEEKEVVEEEGENVEPTEEAP